MSLWYLLIAAGVVVADGDGVHQPPINLAVLLPIADEQRPFSAVKLRPAVDLAVGKVSHLLPRRMQATYSDSKCSPKYGINEAINSFIRGPPDVYFGPICDYAVAPIARQSYFWNIPVVSVGALAVDFLSNRYVSYPLLTRAGPVNLVGLVQAILEAMHAHNWRRVKLLYDRDARSEVIPPFCHFAIETMIYLLESASSRRIDKKDHHKFDPDPDKVNFHEMLVNEVGHTFAGK